MSDVLVHKVLQELAKRKGIKKFKVEDYCFGKQLDFIRDPNRLKIACTSRRSGKTVMAAADLMDSAVSHPDTNNVYITGTRDAGKKIIWKYFKDINSKYNLGGVQNEMELTLSFANGSKVFIQGAKDENDAGKFRGMGFKRVYIDEAQKFKSNLLYKLLNEDLQATMQDYPDAVIAIMGTPGEVLSGQWYDAAHQKDNFEKWSVHKWTWRDNEYAYKGRTQEEYFQQLLDFRNLVEPDGAIKREFLNQWVAEVGEQILCYDPNKNYYENIPSNLNYVIGVDVGFLDSDAIAVLGFPENGNRIYLIEEVLTPRQDWTDLGNDLVRLRKKYNPIRMVIDTGGGGRKGAEDINNRFGLPLEKAEKEPNYKVQWLRYLSDDLRQGRFLIQNKEDSGSEAVGDIGAFHWDKDKEHKLKISGHSDIWDAILYAYRAAYPYFHALDNVEIVKSPNPNSEQWARDYEQRLIEEINTPEKEWWDLN